MLRKELTIGGKDIGATKRPFLIAEISANHNNSLSRAKDLVRAAAKSGADAVKFQTYTADSITLKSDRPDFQIVGGLWDGRCLYDLYEQGSLPYDWHEPLFDLARSLGLAVISSPFDEKAVDFLVGLGVDALKIASFECNHLPLINHAASAEVPLIISTGMASMDEIGNAVSCVLNQKNTDLILLHCVSSYPAPASQYGIKNIRRLTEQFNCLVGLSDHCTTNEIAAASVVMGAVMIEKHFTLSRDAGGLDDSFSLEPEGFRELRRFVDNVYQATSFTVEVTDAEAKSLQFRRSVYCSNAMRKGDVFTPQNIKVVRPGFGLDPQEFPRIIGKRATRDIDFAEPIKESDFSSF